MQLRSSVCGRRVVTLRIRRMSKQTQKTINSIPEILLTEEEEEVVVETRTIRPEDPRVPEERGGEVEAETEIEDQKVEKEREETLTPAETVEILKAGIEIEEDQEARNELQETMLEKEIEVELKITNQVLMHVIMNHLQQQCRHQTTSCWHSMKEETVMKKMLLQFLPTPALAPNTTFPNLSHLKEMRCFPNLFHQHQSSCQD